jgi:O-antigen ligase
VCFLLPLVVFPGLDQPFSTPKLAFLVIVVSVGAGMAHLVGLRAWPSLPRIFQGWLVAWLAAFGASALLGDFASGVAILLPLAAVAWFLLLMVVRPEAEHLALALAISGVVIACVALLQSVGWDLFAQIGWVATPSDGRRMRVYATLGNPDFVAAFLIGVMPLAASVGKTPKMRRLFWIALAIQAMGIFATGSRGAVLAFLAALVWMAALGRLGRSRSFILTVVLVGAALLAWSPARRLATTSRGRFYIWQAVVPHLAEHPVLGFGPGAFAPKYAQWEAERWHRRPSFGQLEFAGFQNHAHNDYLETLVDNGLTGLVSFLGILVCFLVFVLRQQRLARGENLACASAGVVSLAAVALVDFPFQRPAELFLFWTLLAIAFLAASGGPPATIREKQDPKAQV